MVRDGPDSGQFVDRRRSSASPSAARRSREGADLKPNARFKYSNHGYGLLGLAIEAATGEPYRSWLQREIIDAAELAETLADGPAPRSTPLALGHSARLPAGARLPIPGDYSTNALVPAAGW